MSKGQLMDFNVNNHVWVRMTAFGKEVLSKKIDELKISSKIARIALPIETTEGWSQWQLHELMNWFGEYMVPGGPEPFEMTIKVPMTVTHKVTGGGGK